MASLEAQLIAESWWIKDLNDHTVIAPLSKLIPSWEKKPKIPSEASTFMVTP
jgi:hypothetical protein